MKTLQWARWPVGTVIKLQGKIGDMNCFQEQILVRKTDKDYVVRRRTTTNAQTTIKEVQFFYKEKSKKKLSTETVEIQGRRLICDVWEIEYEGDTSVEHLWVDRTDPFGDIEHWVQFNSLF